jgi:hypothetical protein
MSFKLLRSPSESNLFSYGLSLDQLTDAWNNLSTGFGFLLLKTPCYWDFAIAMTEIQSIIFNKIVEPSGDKHELISLDDICEFIYSVIPTEEKELLGDSTEDFVMSVCFPNFIKGEVHSYNSYLSWMPKINVQLINVTLGEPRRTLILTNLRKQLLEDLILKNDTEKIFHKMKRFIDEPIQEYERSLRGILFQIRALGYMLASQPVCHSTVSTFVFFLIKNMDSVNENSGMRLGILCLQALSFIKDERFLTTVVAAAFAISRDDREYLGTRVQAMRNWFMPWYGQDLVTGVFKPLMTLRDLEIAIIAELDDCYIDFFDLEGKESLEKSLKIFDFLKEMFTRTEFNAEFIDVLIRDNSKYSGSGEFIDVLVCFFTPELALFLAIDLPFTEFAELWFRDPLKLNRYNGIDRSIYPKWRYHAMRLLLQSDNKDSRGALIRSILRKPLVSELQKTLNRKHSMKKSFVVSEIFLYLDEAFQFKVDSAWIESDLHKNIQLVISGINSESEKEIAILASTWKCASFEQYMKLVNSLC